MKDGEMLISLAPDDQLLLTANKHTIKVPATVVGLKYIIQTLRGQRIGKTKLAEEGAPTQWEIDNAVRDWKQKHPLLKPKSKPSKYNIEVELDL